MDKLKFLFIIFFVILILSFPISLISPQKFAILMVIDALIIALGIHIFYSGYKVKKIGRIKIESAQYPLTYVLRAYTDPKNLWIVYDEKTKKFRTADWSNLPVRVFLAILISLFLIYTSFLIWFTIAQDLYLIFFRATVLFIFFFVGLYGMCVGLYRLFSFNNRKADKICSFLNRNKILSSLIEKGILYVQVTPNFLIKEGFVNSVEFILAEKVELERLEKILIETAKLIQKL
jgi:hypothetical protein